MTLKSKHLKIYSTLAQQKLPFQPLVPDTVSMYVCGMTVYDRCHVGHGRSMVVFDMVARYLRYLGYRVNHVRNITDVDDKIIARALDNKEPIEALTERCIAAMHEDELALLNQLPDQEPRATAHMSGMIQMIESLIAKSYAYVADNGDVYFKVAAFASYGELLRQDMDSLRAGARVDVVSAKRDPLDFVLWKLAKTNEPSWPSPWGAGRPGWHIECSAMSHHCLGEQIDIHGGGLDLRFPHHQNEIAQSEALMQKPLAGYWMHAGHVQVDRVKMSKSLGNFFTLKEVLQTYPGEVVRYFMLASHYRSPVNYTEVHLQHATDALARLYTVLRDAAKLTVTEEPVALYDEGVSSFHVAMDDDFNTPEALAVLFDMCRAFHRCKESDPKHAMVLRHTIKHLAAVLGLLASDPMAYLQGNLSAEQVAEVQAWVQQREQARTSKDWALADKLRDKLHAAGIRLEDTAEGTIWRYQAPS